MAPCKIHHVGCVHFLCNFSVFVNPEKAKNCTFRKYLEQYRLELVGGFHTQAVRRVCAVGDEVRLQNVGLHHPCIPEDGSKDTLCVVCSKKYNNEDGSKDTLFCMLQ